MAEQSSGSLIMQAKVYMAGMERDKAEAYFEAWRALDSDFTANVKKGTKVFEIHHSLETMRRKFCMALLDGKSAKECAEAAKLA